MESNRAAEFNGGDDEEEALRQAIAMSLGDEGSGPAKDNKDTKDTKDSPSSPGPSKGTSLPTTSMSALGIDRRKMEEERLARLKKRKAGTNFDAQGQQEGLPPARRPKIMDEKPACQPTLSQPALPTPPSGLNPNSSRDRGGFGMPKGSATVRLPYPKGTVLRTWVRGMPRQDDIKIEEVLQKDDLELAVLSSFQWDEEWLMAKLNMATTRVLLVAYAPDDATKNAMRGNVPQGLIKFCFPPMEYGASCMHSKLQLLKFPRYIRIVVPTGNLVPYDWGETGVMENMAFLIDLPRIEDPTKRATNTLTPFGTELQFFLKAQGVDDKMVASLQNYDFSETSRYGFLHTIGGSHSNIDVWKRTGYCGLGRTVKALGLGSDGNIDMDYICSSIGAVNSDLLTALYNACKGDSGMKEYSARTGKQRKSKDVSSATKRDFEGHIRVYFPSRDTVRQSLGGTNSAGTISFQPRWWESKSFPSEILRDCKNVRPGMLLHSKIIFVRRPVSDTDSSASAWAYVGSHNLSESAWGRLVKDRTTGQPKLNARNWECGVLIPASTSRPPSMKDPHAYGAPADGTTEGPQMLELFRGVVPIPIQLPGAPYCDGDNFQLRPWFYQGN
ncbi:hypothetical protein VMCG_00047 [Cytospora schulzeri]|uniref:PLD phosphodiesterase domain-containing protein n=1 Tax=Cytospora schulzeri TaxID=448051 RepID=A0A423X7Z4_9PEZI|nr:hypothetical protein VMCG_00047 [Valsa malicola]